MQEVLNKNISSASLSAKRIIIKKDPPGQKCFYILPGDNRSEVYRASTFRYFPNGEVDPLKLAINGFYFTGYKDRAKCFSCGMAVEDWKSGDDQDFSRLHFSDCGYMHGRDTSNIPLGIRKMKKKRNPTTNSFLTESSHSSEQNGSHSISTNQIRSNAAQRINLQRHSHENESIDEADIRSRMELFPCLNAINPHMHNVQARLRTFNERAENWPAERINATFQQLADAGFFYLGERDRVKCWYCNGGIQHWEREDDAWEEHAKWFPMCEHVLRKKGAQYVQDIVQRFPNIPRPPLYNSAINAPFNIGRQVQRRTEVQQNQSPVIIDPRKKQEEQLKKIEEEMKSSEIVAKALMLGFEEIVIRRVLKSQYFLHDKSFSTFEAMVEAMLANNSDDEATDEEKSKTSKRNSTNLSLIEKLKTMIESKKCHICRKEESNIVFLPCGHLVCCIKCSKDVKKCPKCQSEISEKIRSYIS